MKFPSSTRAGLKRDDAVGPDVDRSGRRASKNVFWRLLAERHHFYYRTKREPLTLKFSTANGRECKFRFSFASIGVYSQFF